MASSLFVATLSFALLFCSTLGADLVDETCSMALNKPLCLQVFRSDPRSKGADLRGLGEIVLEKAQAATKASLEAAKSVANGGNQRIIKGCIVAFGEGIGNLGQCSRLLKARDRASINALQSKAFTVQTNLKDCDREFGRDEPAKLKQATGLALDLLDILLVVSNGF